MDKIKVAAYCRVSTDYKDQENSYANQKRYFEREIKKNAEYELVEIYADKGITGTSLSRRDNFNKMLCDAGLDMIEVQNVNDRKSRKTKYTFMANMERKPKFNLIMTKNTSRFARNVLITDIIRELKRKEVYVYFLDVNKTTENEADEMLLQMLFVMDENESKDRSRKTLFGHFESAKQGVIHTNSRLYGYEYIQETNELKIIPEEAKNIRLMFELYAKGYGMRRIINYLTTHEIYTREGKEFAKSTINRILQNEKYAGTLVRNKYTNGTVFNKYGAKLKPKNEWIYHKDRVPAIISVELFKKCQEIRQSRVDKYHYGVNTGYTKYAGLIKCGKCGNNYTSNVDRGKRFYNCSLKKRKGVEYCNNNNVSLELLEKIIRQEYKRQVDNLDVRREDIILYLGVLEHNITTSDKSIVDRNKLKKELGQIEEEESKLVDLYLNSLITKDIYENKFKFIQDKKEKIASLLYTYEDQIEAYKTLDKKIGNFIKIIVEEIDKLKNEKDIYKYIKQITVNSKDEIIVEFDFLNIDEELEKLDFLDNSDIKNIDEISNFYWD